MHEQDGWAKRAGADDLAKRRNITFRVDIRLRVFSAQRQKGLSDISRIERIGHLCSPLGGLYTRYSISDL